MLIIRLEKPLQFTNKVKEFFELNKKIAKN